RTNVQTTAAVRKSDDAALGLGPFEDRQVPARPILDLLRARVILLVQPEKTDVSAMARREAGYLNVIAKQMLGRGKWMDLPLKEGLLMIPAWSPAQAAADVE